MRTGEAGVRKFIVLWCAFLVVIYALAIILVTAAIKDEKEAATFRHESIFDPSRAEPGHTKAEARLVDLGRAPKKLIVSTGIYVDRISEVSIKDSRWIVDFYVWFRWHDKNIRPGESFHMVNGKILSRELETSYDTEDEHYALYEVSVEITKLFDIARFPLDDHLLTICSNLF